MNITIMILKKNYIIYNIKIWLIILKNSNNNITLKCSLLGIYRKIKLFNSQI